MSVRFLGPVLAVAILAAGCGGDSDDDESSATRPETSTKPSVEKSCPPRLTWNESDYLGSDVRLPAQIGEPLGRATIPACGPNKERSVQIARIPGVEASVAVVHADDAFDVWVAKTARAASYPPALKRIVFGLTCEENRPFTLTGRLVGLSSTSDPLIVRLDTDSVVAKPAYRGVEVDLVVRASTEGLNTRDALSEVDPDRTKLRVGVRCVEAGRPDRTFLAQSITAGTAGG
jgi:hypothetical protein